MKSQNILKKLMERYGFKSQFFFCPEKKDVFEDLILYLEERNLKSSKIDVKENRARADVFLITIDGNALNYKDEIFEGVPSVVVLYFSETAEKKYIFPVMEAAGYRMYVEDGAFVYFFLMEENTQYDSDILSAGSSEVSQALEGSKWKKSPFVLENSGQFVTVPAYELLNANRFDIAIKAHYARLKSNNMADSWREYAYYEQALRITGPNKDLVEYDGSGKQGLASFLNGFHSLLQVKDTSKIPYFPIDRNNISLDGAHRVASSIVREQPVRAIQFDEDFFMPSTVEYYAGYDHGHSPCPQEILEEGVIEYCRIKDSAAIALIFPCVPQSSEAVKILEGIADIVHQKDAFMTPKAGGVLFRQAYSGQPWLDQSGKSTGFDHKVRSCFPFSGKMRVIVLDRFSSQDLRPAKEEIRALCGLGKHSIHITDSTEETLRIARALFNANSFNMMVQGTGKPLPGFHNKLDAYKKWAVDNNINPEHICLDGSTVLSALGLRECNDIDFLYHGSPEALPSRPKGIGCHNDIAHYYSQPVSEIIGNPRFHFWYMDVKFCAPSLISDMKKKRNELKDKIDVKLLETIEESCFNKMTGKMRFLILKAMWHVRPRLSLLIKRIKRKIKTILSAIRISRDV